MLQARYRRAGSPVLHIFGEKRENEQLRVGMLFISAQLDDREYELFDPDKPDAQPITVKLPEALIDLSADAMRANVALEVIR